MKTLAVTLIVALMSCSGMAQYKLEYKASAPLAYKAHTTVESTQTMMNQESTFSMLMNQSISMTSINSGSDLVYRITIDSSDNVTVLPSGDTNRAPSPVVGKVRETRIHPNGEEISSTWLDTAFAGTAAGQMKEPGSLFFKLPAEKVDIGAIWHEDKVDTAGTPGGMGNILVKTGTDYKFVDKENIDGVPCARIKFTGKITMNGTANGSGMNLVINGTGTVAGSVLFDYGAGKIVKTNFTSNQDLTMTSSGDNPMTIPMDQKIDYELSLAK
ncbi:MAG: hypothetical protein ACLP05_05560 [Candidatus Kryptoniota bacterium]